MILMFMKLAAWNENDHLHVYDQDCEANMAATEKTGSNYNLPQIKGWTHHKVKLAHCT